MPFHFHLWKGKGGIYFSLWMKNGEITVIWRLFSASAFLCSNGCTTAMDLHKLTVQDGDTILGDDS